MVALHVANNGDSVASRDTLPDEMAAEVEQVKAAWPDLPAAVRAGILAMIQAAGAERPRQNDGA